MSKYHVKFALIALVILIMLALAGCGPQTDATDPLSDYSVDVIVPYATAAPITSTTANPASTQRTYVMTTGQAVKIVGWMNDTLYQSDEDQYTELSIGSIGTAVKNLQKRLIELNYMSGTALGTYDAATAQAVKNFERMYGRVETGVASKLMQVYLYSASAKTYDPALAATQAPSTGVSGYVQLERGSSGSAVTSLQNRLIELGYLSGAATGYYDSNTENAIREFEAAYGKQRTGIATVALQAYLYASGAYRAGTTAAPVSVNVNTTPAPAGNYSKLQKGNKGDAVTRLQTRLYDLGYYTGDIDGIYGNGTVAAVKRFEAAYGQKQTGVATPTMQEYLFSSSARAYQNAASTPAPSSYQTLSYGSYGSQVTSLQKRLIELGYLSGSADGYYGSDTQNAVKAFEKQYGKTQTGVATASMQKFLFAGDALAYSDTSLSQNYSTLSRGSKGTEVAVLQNRLIELGYLSGKADGSYGAKTVSAVMAFEAAYDKPQTGVATAEMQSYLFADDARRNPATESTPKPTEYTTLKSGDKGTAVRDLQNRLVELKYLTGTVDGVFGDGTKQAVMAFEAMYNQPQTGVATSELQAYLFSENAKYNTGFSAAVSYTTLEAGDSGNAVTALQDRLLQLGYYSGFPSGKFDAQTVNAVKRFQQTLGLNATGAATSQLQKTLFSADAPAANAAYPTPTPVPTATPTPIPTLLYINRTAYINQSVVYVYAEADAASNVIGQMSTGSKVTVVRTRGEWAEIQNNAGDIGYVYVSQLTVAGDATPAPTPASKPVTVNKAAVVSASSGITVYSEADTNSFTKGELKSGTQVMVLRVNGEWAEIQNAAGEIGYAYYNQLTVLEGSVGAAQNAAGIVSMSTGDTGEAVKRLQTRLKTLGYFDGSIGGNYLTKTTAAVRLFQAAIGAEQTGVASVELQEILYSGAAPAYEQYSAPETEYYQILRFNDVGDDVKQLQECLAYLKYLNLGETTLGQYDAATMSAVANVQSAMGMSEINGIASAELQAYLFSDASDAIRR